jgi:protocatechuate 3,4-dioxygenase beta subunit
MGIGASVLACARAGRSWAACAVTPSETEGPFWVDERLQRSDIRIDPSDGSVEPGVPLQLALKVLRADDDCSPVAGVQVDIWHCDAGGLYSDEAANNTVGRKFLRGYQLTDSNGGVQFTTIYPGWYSGRTVHIHFRIRTFDGTTTTYNFASQLFFDDAISDQVLAQSPYDTRGARDTTNTNDGIFNAATLLALTADGSGGYVGTFDVALNGLPAGVATPGATVSPSVTPSPELTPTSTVPSDSCSGDCNGDGSVTVDELVTLVNTALGTASTCPNGIPSGTQVDIAFLIQSVNRALTGCG